MFPADNPPEGCVVTGANHKTEVAEDRADAERLPDPASLPPVGSARRPTPIGNRTLWARRAITASFRDLERAILAELESSGALAAAFADASEFLEDKGKDAIGRGGRPLGDERRLRIERILKRNGIVVVSEALDSILEGWSLELELVLAEQYRAAYDVGARGGRRKLGLSPSFELRNPAVLDALKERANLLSGRGVPMDAVSGTGGVAQDVFNRMRTVIGEEFYLEGKNPIAVARSLRSEFSWLKRSRAELIARTETLTIVEEGQQTLFETAGVKWKRWLTMRDGRERPEHRAAHGQLVPIGELFELKLVPEGRVVKLRFPGDSGGEGSSKDVVSMIVNCRCDNEAVVLEGQEFDGATVWDGTDAPEEAARRMAA